MHLTHLTIRDFRNLQEVAIEPCPRFNVLAGDNGQGKTNLIAAIYWLATLRPLRTRRLRELVRWGEKATRVEGLVLHEDLKHRLAVSVAGGSREAYRENKKASASAFFGALRVVVFTPDDVGLVRGTPEARRRFLDRAVFTERPTHLADVLTYRRALEGRNTLIREGASLLQYEVYEQTLAQAAARLIVARQACITALAPRYKAAFEAIAGTALPVSISYRTQVQATDTLGLAEGLMQMWADDRSRDRARGFTQRGPHTDELVLRLLDRPAKAYASQGQQRAMVLALKIAEIESLRATTGHAPILLLDDVSSELDPQRTERLFEFLEGFEGQVFITTTDPAFLRIKGQRRVWQVQAGALINEE